MVDIQSAAAEIRRGKKEERRRTNHSMKIYMVSLLHRATIKSEEKGITGEANNVNKQTIYIAPNQQMNQGCITPRSPHGPSVLMEVSFYKTDVLPATQPSVSKH